MTRTLDWQIATVKATRQETPNVKTLTLALPSWTAHRAGQHYDIRLTAEDGYSAQRSYSVASEPERAGVIDITVERIGEGEVSPFLDDIAVVGDRFEPGMVFAFNIDLFDPNWHDGKTGCVFAETVEITDTDARRRGRRQPPSYLQPEHLASRRG